MEPQKKEDHPSWPNEFPFHTFPWLSRGQQGTQVGAKTHRHLNSQPCLEKKSYIMMKEGFEGFLMAKVMEWFALLLA